MQKVLLTVFFLVSLNAFVQEPKLPTLGLIGLCVLEEYQADVKASCLHGFCLFILSTINMPFPVSQAVQSHGIFLHICPDIRR
jgi:hypothetical protein